MAMSKRSGGEKQEGIWIAHTELAEAPGHPFYERLNELLEGAGFDGFVEGLCARFYHARLGRPSLMPRGLFPCAADRVFRGHRWRAWDRLAGGGFASAAAVSAVPNDHRFACPATYCRCWSAPLIIIALPH